MKLNELNRNQLKSELILLMDKVASHLRNESDVDKFLDETNLFDDWELILPESEFSVFIITVLNDIRKDSIMDTIIDSCKEKKKRSTQKNSSNLHVEPDPRTSELCDHPFN